MNVVEIKVTEVENLFIDNKNNITYRVVNGTYYHEETSREVIDILEDARNSNCSYRLKISLGDAKTGKAWGDVNSGYIGRSTGSVKIPLLIYNKRSHGGPGLLDHCIVKIEIANKKFFHNRKNSGIMYKHSNFHTEK